MNKWIRLTPDKQSKLGWLWSRIPFTSNSWIIEFDFRVHGEGSLFGDGFAFWYTSDRAQTGPIFGSRDNFDGLIIAFDTYSNGKHKVRLRIQIFFYFSIFSFVISNVMIFYDS